MQKIIDKLRAEHAKDIMDDTAHVSFLSSESMREASDYDDYLHMASKLEPVDHYTRADFNLGYERALQDVEMLLSK